MQGRAPKGIQHPVAMSPYQLVGPHQVMPLRHGGPYVSNPAAVNLSELSSFMSYPMPAKNPHEKAKELELKYIKQTLKKSNLEQIDEIKKANKWEIEALR